MVVPVRIRRLALFASLGVLALAGCSGDRTPGRTLALSECRLPKLATAAQCGTLRVPENRRQPDGRAIDIFVAVLPANTTTPRPDPFVILAGGPGQAASQLAPLAARLSEIRRTRDIVLIDQRGTGRSAPLVCDAFKPDDDPESALEADPVPKARACAEELRAAGVDAAQYTTAAWIDDLEAMRVALGYPTLNLWGGSYGSRVALEYMRRHPERLRSVVLDGVAPPSMKITLDVWFARERALARFLAACERSAACRSAHPDLPATLDTIAERLGPNGRRVELVDPQTGAGAGFTLTFDTFLLALQPLTYVPELAALLPEMIARAAVGDFGPLFAAALSVTDDIAEQVDTALHYSVVCAEDVPRIDAADREAASRLRTARLARRAMEVCDVWPRGDADPQATRPVESAIPTLILSGVLDPVTPPANGDAVAKTLSNSRHVIAAGYGHIVSPHACAPRLIAAFVADAGFERLPARCIDYLTASVPPPPWPDRLAPSP